MKFLKLLLAVVLVGGLLVYFSAKVNHGKGEVQAKTTQEAYFDNTYRF